jgi:hypothetical protein
VYRSGHRHTGTAKDSTSATSPRSKVMPGCSFAENEEERAVPTGPCPPVRDHNVECAGCFAVAVTATAVEALSVPD